jgi:OCT family organic cation transporter-like MFS transporter 4/5
VDQIKKTKEPNLHIFRWLLAQGRLEEAENIVRKIAKYNGNPLPSEFHLTASQGDDQQAKKTGGIFTFLNLFKTPNMRMKTLIIYYCWFTTSMIYYGLTLNSNNVGGSLFQIYCFGKGT